MARRILLFTLLALCAFAALAGRYDTMRKQVEASRLVSGEVVVAPDGAVQSYTLDRADALPTEVKQLLAEVVPGWELDVAKAEGGPLQSPAAVRMSVQLLARPIPGADDQLRVMIQDTAFWDPKAPVQVEAKGKLTPLEFISWNQTPKAEHGRWRAYVPGPYASIPWQSRTADGGEFEGRIGAMVPGQFYSTDAPIRLRGSPAGT